MINSLKLSPFDIFFFSIFFIVFPILTDFEYNLYEHTGTYPTYVALLERLIFSVLRTVPYWLYYKLVLPLLFKKSYWLFAGQVGIFLLLLDGYIHYVVYGLVMNLWFLPESIVRSAGRWYSSSAVLHFSIVYVIRELVMVSTLGYYHQSADQQRRLYQLNQHQLQTELDSLKTQLQPHFFFNTLNNMYALALQESSQTAPLIARHADIMRYILYRSRLQQVPLGEEIKFLTDYAAVESMRFSDKASIQFDTQGIHNGVVIEPLLLLPFIENTFKHGLSQPVQTGFVHIVLVLIETELILETRNSRFQHAGPNTDDSGIGLQNGVKQLNLLYPGRHKLSIQQDETVYTLRLQVNLRTNG